MPVAIEEHEHQVVDVASSDQRRLRGRTLPAARIVLVPFTLVEVEQLAEDDGR